jgi:hypothetical protein
VFDGVQYWKDRTARERAEQDKAEIEKLREENEKLQSAQPVTCQEEDSDVWKYVVGIGIGWLFFGC